MFCGLDFGTSHCALGILNGGQSKLLPLFNGKCFTPSSLYAFDRGLISEFVASKIELHSTPDSAKHYKHSRLLSLQQAPALRRQHGLSNSEVACFVGQEAVDEYLEMPDEGYYIKSPKSFLGASGLLDSQIMFFQDVISAMMLVIKQQAEANLGASLEQVVIGKPVNFQGSNADASNKQALAILSESAKLAGYKDVEFLYEPLAAGLDFETKLECDKCVLVVDIGGGTTDCSIVNMGPKRQNNIDRQGDFLAHTGKRIGGNDLDIHLAFKQLMPLFGMDGQFKSGITLPRKPFWNAVSINNLVEQSEFYSRSNVLSLQQMQRDAAKSIHLKRLLKLQQSKQNHRLVRLAELAKIELSDKDVSEADLSFIENDLISQINKQELADAISQPVVQMQALVKEALAQANTSPDLIYITGGSAKSEILREAVASELSNVPIVDGDYFGSVTAGLSQWAGRIFA